MIGRAYIRDCMMYSYQKTGFDANGSPRMSVGSIALVVDSRECMTK
jgi:hypothetical protein